MLVHDHEPVEWHEISCVRDLRIGSTFITEKVTMASIARYNFGHTSFTLSYRLKNNR